MRKEYTAEMNQVIAAYKENRAIQISILAKALADACDIFGMGCAGNGWNAMIHDSNAHWDNVVYQEMRALENLQGQFGFMYKMF